MKENELQPVKALWFLCEILRFFYRDKIRCVDVLRFSTYDLCGLQLSLYKEKQVILLAGI